MKIKYISPIGKESDLLFQTFTPTFESKGHQIVNDVREADVAFYDLYSYLGRYNTEDIIDAHNKRLPIVAFDESDYGGMSKEKFNSTVWDEVHNRQKLIYFMRKMDKTIEYPKYVYPYEKIIQCEFEPTTKEELFSRRNDICFIGNSSPQRNHVVNGLLNAGLKMDIHWTNEKGKLPHDEWIARHRHAKLFLSADGGGFSDERAYQLITIAPMLKNRNNHLQVHRFSDLTATCVEVDEIPTRFDIEDLQIILSEPETIFMIYQNGIERMKKYYTAEYRASYILKILSEHGII